MDDEHRMETSTPQPLQSTRPQHIGSIPLVSSPDRGSPRAAFVAGVACCLLLGAIILMNQVFGRPSAQTTPETTNATEIVPGDGEPFGMSARATVKLAHLLRTVDPNQNLEPVLGKIDESAKSTVEKFRGAIAVAELSGTEAAKKSLDLIPEKDLEAAGLSGDVSSQLPVPHQAAGVYLAHQPGPHA